MLISVHGAKCVGIDAVRVTVEVDIDHGIGIHLVGLADVAVKESLLRTTTALQALGYRIPGKKIVINLAPADMHKSGSGYDLPIAIGVIAASGQASLPLAGRYVMMGELGLDGSVRGVNGALPFAELSVREGFDGIILPRESASEAARLQHARVYGVTSLDEVVRILSREDCGTLLSKLPPDAGTRSPDIPDFADIIGQEAAKRAMEIAAAGGHNLAMVGPPGSGKSSLAKALVGILPPMVPEESLQTAKIFSIAGKGAALSRMGTSRPFRAPHYSASMAAIIGGGAGDNIMPGEISLAQNGVLFLDEAAQMPRSVIEALRGPIEDRKVVISRLRSKVEYPSSFMLVLASNPCPCGYWGEGDRCTCTPGQRLGYLSRLSGPIMDRIDLQLFVPALSAAKIVQARQADAVRETSGEVAGRVAAARLIQRLRFSSEGISVNAEMNNKQVERYCPLDAACEDTLIKLLDSLGLSMRAYFRIIKLARTIADLESSPDILPGHISEAAAYRFLDRLAR